MIKSAFLLDWIPLNLISAFAIISIQDRLIFTPFSMLMKL